MGLAMLYVKGDYYLSEFISGLKHAIELAIPFEDMIMNDENEINPNTNIFEGYKNYDLAFLRGYAIITP